jgi:hypothetical protein
MDTGGYSRPKNVLSALGGLQHLQQQREVWPREGLKVLVEVRLSWSICTQSVSTRGKLAPVEWPV